MTQDSIENYLDELEDILESAKVIRFSKNISVNKEELFEVIRDIRMNLPTIIKDSQRINDNCTSIINDANNKATLIIREAEDQAQKLVSEHEITKLATANATAIIEDAKTTSKDMRLSAIEYADELLSRTEKAIKSFYENYTGQYRNLENCITQELNVIYENRQELRGNTRAQQQEQIAEQDYEEQE